jgi:hypothetical protein
MAAMAAEAEAAVLEEADMEDTADSIGKMS